MNKSNFNLSRNYDERQLFMFTAFVPLKGKCRRSGWPLPSLFADAKPTLSFIASDDICKDISTFLKG